MADHAVDQPPSTTDADNRSSAPRFPATRRPLVRVRDYLELLERSTYRGDRVR